MNLTTRAIAFIQRSEPGFTGAPDALLKERVCQILTQMGHPNPPRLADILSTMSRVSYESRNSGSVDFADVTFDDAMDQLEDLVFRSDDRWWCEWCLRLPSPWRIRLDENEAVFISDCGECVPIYESAEQFIESDAMSDSLLEVSSKEPWHWYRCGLSTGSGKSIETGIGLQKVDHASERYSKWWHAPDVFVHYFLQWAFEVPRPEVLWIFSRDPSIAERLIAKVQENTAVQWEKGLWGHKGKK